MEPEIQMAVPHWLSNPPGLFPYLLWEIQMKHATSINNSNPHMTKRQFALRRLYDDAPFNCKICGMKFYQNKLLTDHMDDHFQSNKEIKDINNLIAWSQYSTLQNWINDTSIIRTNKEEDQTESDEIFLPYTKEDNKCFICEEPFQIIALRENDEWCFSNACKAWINKIEVKIHANHCAKQLDDEIKELEEG